MQEIRLLVLSTEGVTKGGRHKKTVFFLLLVKESETPPPPFFDHLSFFLIRIKMVKKSEYILIKIFWIDLDLPPILYLPLSVESQCLY